MKIPLIGQVVIHVIMTILTGGLWMIGLIIWYFLVTAKK